MKASKSGPEEKQMHIWVEGGEWWRRQQGTTYGPYASEKDAANASLTMQVEPTEGPGTPSDRGPQRRLVVDIKGG